ncbi:hypothetical protein RW115_10805 [Macrococcus capreoli]|uniref:COG4705 family protein n=1 Tax=Macrococcus capreoli TaxID=2982690 RepID=UPI0021D5F9A9|nr:hypothetical protein [Macrococcus sp. TMW 2.2395]MCU7558237.1 hypothetical protein [Macrococcus sp. TMW 2.2395]
MDTKTKKMMNKVPQITVFFWVIKILCTTVGETFADFINFNIGLGLTVTTLIMGIALIIALIFQFKTNRYRPLIYWITVVLLSVFGTLVTDNLTDNLSVPLEVSTIVFLILLGLTFLLWYISEKTLSIHSVFTLKREIFYWLTILFTFALGTAVGDLYSEQLGLGYLYTGIGVTLIIAAIYIAYKYFKLNSILAFWMAYILTRPLGASLGDLLSQPKTNGGLGFGTTITSIIFLVAILGIIIYLATSKIDRVESTNIATITINSQQQKRVLFQTIIVLAVSLALGVGGYTVRMHSIHQANHKVSFKSEMKQFATIELAINDAAKKQDFKLVNKKADQLERDWDKQEPKLRSLDSKQWTQVDVTIDGVLSAARDSQSSTAKIANAVKQSQDVIHSLN